MPREFIKRGKRAQRRGPRQERKARQAEKKRKLEVEPDEEEHHKRHKVGDADTAENAEYHHDLSAQNGAPQETPFYGLLDEEEQKYFTHTGEMLELNQFDGPDERTLFLANVYKEANGKELRLACSQSSSRLMERLILLSDANQLKVLFQKFSGK